MALSTKFLETSVHNILETVVLDILETVVLDILDTVVLDILETVVLDIRYDNDGRFAQVMTSYTINTPL